MDDDSWGEFCDAIIGIVAYGYVICKANPWSLFRSTEGTQNEIV